MVNFRVLTFAVCLCAGAVLALPAYADPLPEKGPNGGLLRELGEHHIELLVKGQALTVHLLDHKNNTTFEAGVLVATPDISSERAADVSEVADLARACKLEAKRGHFKHASSQRSEIEAHKRRMSILCDALSVATANGQDGVVRKCKSEAAWGARHVHRGGNADRSHMLRLQRLCDKLAYRDQESS